MSNKNQCFGEAVPLDEDQMRFCEADGQLIRLLAPAGCGKTHSLLWRCLFQLRQTKDEKPKFLVFTFTRAARDELMDRLRSDGHFHDLRDCTRVSTLNSWGYQRVKKTAHNLQLITNQAQKYNCVNNILQPVWRRHPQVNKLLDDSYRRASVSKELIDVIDTLKSMAFRHDMYSKGALSYIDNHLIWLNQCGMARNYNALLNKMLELEFIYNTSEEQIKQLFDFWAQSCEHLYQCAYFTLEDQKYWTWIELEQTLEKTGKVAGAARYHHIVVDEFQDINPLDLHLLKTIVAHNNATLTIIGDEDQAIFEWRGATPSFILNPDKYFGTKSKTFILGTNYRSPRNIISYSQQLIRNNKRRENKKVVANQVGNAKIEVIRNENITQSIEFILDYIENWRNSSFGNSIAIVGRKRSQIIPFQIVFAGCDIQFLCS
jgi:DNA helicase-2/ATP-dependent DNA helicase PcrA